jgi:hypothetical protein
MPSAMCARLHAPLMDETRYMMSTTVSRDMSYIAHAHESRYTAIQGTPFHVRDVCIVWRKNAGTLFFIASTLQEFFLKYFLVFFFS